MNKYETVFLINDAITEEERKKVIDKITKYISDNGTIDSQEDIGLKKLAYTIKNHSNAYYYLINFKMNAKSIAELERIYRIIDEILKFIVVKKY